MSGPTSFIKRKAAASLLHSVRTAEAIGRPFNTFVTVSLWHLGLGPEDASRFFRDVRERHFQRWSSYVPRGWTMSPIRQRGGGTAGNSRSSLKNSASSACSEPEICAEINILLSNSII